MSGSAGKLISIKRVLATDATPTAAAGWNSSFDSKVVVSPSNANPIDWQSQTTGSYLLIDGRVDSGIQLRIANVGYTWSGAVCFAKGGQHDITLTNIDMAGPGGNNTFNSNLGIFTSTGVSSITVAACRIHGAPNVIKLLNVVNTTFDHCRIYDSGAINMATYHPNLIEYLNCSNNTFKYCEISSWAVEGFMVYGECGPLYVYGCVWHDPGWNNGGPVKWASGTGKNRGGQGPRSEERREGKKGKTWEGAH